MFNEEEMIQCPYNVSHIVLKSRMPYHLRRCREQYPAESFATCPFNATHDVPAPELEYHIRTCQDRRELEKSIYVLDPPKPHDERAINIDLPSSSENWDKDFNPVGSYLNVKEKEIEKQKVFRQPIGKPRSERKTFFQKESEKFNKEPPKEFFYFTRRSDISRIRF